MSGSVATFGGDFIAWTGDCYIQAMAHTPTAANDWSQKVNKAMQNAQHEGHLDRNQPCLEGVMALSELPCVLCGA